MTSSGALPFDESSRHFVATHARNAHYTGIAGAGEGSVPVSEQEVPVLVVGGSLVGLTTSVLLASYGVRHMLIERHKGTAIHPRAASFHFGRAKLGIGMAGRGSFAG